MTGDEDRFYVVTPIDIILAQKTTPSDHIDWLISRERYKVWINVLDIIISNEFVLQEAMLFVEDPNNSKTIPPVKIKV